MSKENQVKATQHHDKAAPAHPDAADHHRRGDAVKAHDKPANAQPHSKKAHEASGMDPAKAREPASRR